MKYLFITGVNPREFQDAINAAADHGFEVIGSVGVTALADSKDAVVIFTVLMVKKR